MSLSQSRPTPRCRHPAFLLIGEAGGDGDTPRSEAEVGAGRTARSRRIVRPASPHGLRLGAAASAAMLETARAAPLRSAEISSGGSKLGARFASVLTTAQLAKAAMLARIESRPRVPGFAVEAGR